jgi:hypothetical protein
MNVWFHFRYGFSPLEQGISLTALSNGHNFVHIHWDDPGLTPILKL